MQYIIAQLRLLYTRVQGAMSNEMEHSYWSRISNWSQSFQTNVQDENKSNCDLIYIASFWSKNQYVQTKQTS
jgi:hypothetical protein